MISPASSRKWSSHRSFLGWKSGLTRSGSKPKLAMSEPFQALQRMHANARLSGEELPPCLRLMM